MRSKSWSGEYFTPHESFLGTESCRDLGIVRSGGAWQHMHDMLRGMGASVEGRQRWRASVDGVEPSIAGPYVQAPAGKHRGSMDGLTKGELQRSPP